MKTKKRLAIVAALLLTSSVVGMTACGDKVKDTESDLEIFCTDAGYKTEWCNAIIDLFKQQDWVKEKYPNLTVTLSTNDDQTYANSRLDAGKKANTIDLLFGMNMWGYAGAGSNAMDLTDVLYNSTVPGESILYKEKMQPSYLLSNQYRAADSDEITYYTTSWAGGMNTILYNEDLFVANDLKVPNTTDELIEICKQYKAKETETQKKYSFVQSFDAVYFNYLFPIWWAQYEGLQGYENFFGGIDNDTYSSRIFDQKGREYSLGVFEALLDDDKGYVSPYGFSQRFMATQAAFIKGESLMHVNGDWFSSEMLSVMQREGDNAPTIKTMRLPIISKLGEKLGITDAELSAIVEYVDKIGAGESAEVPTFTSTKNYTTEKVLNAVKEARTIVHALGSNHHAVVPTYAKAKDVAIDFLRFMATDIALEAYTKTTVGATLPFIFTVPQEVYNSLPVAQQTRLDYFQSANGINTLIAPEYFPLVRYGGLAPFVGDQYYQTFSITGNKKTAADFMRETKNSWDDKKFANALASAGLK